MSDREFTVVGIYHGTTEAFVDYIWAGGVDAAREQFREGCPDIKCLGVIDGHADWFDAEPIE